MRAAAAHARIETERVVAIIRTGAAGRAADAVHALVEGGLGTVEISLAGAGALEAIALAATAHPDALVGAGTVRGIDDAERAVSAGAAFLISPHLDRELVAWAARHDVLHVPGAFTPTEVCAALDAGARLVKLFPAARLGPRYVTDLLAPFPEARLVPTGGVGPADAGDYLAAGAAAVAIGGSLVNEDTMADLDRLSDLVRMTRAATLSPSPTQ